jgi:hypothetical protein
MIKIINVITVFHVYMDIIKNENLIIYWFYIILDILKNDEINKK